LPPGAPDARGGVFSARTMAQMAIGVANSILARSKGVVLVILIGRQMGPGALGIWSQVMGTSLLVACLALWGLDRRLLLVLPTERDRARQKAQGTGVWLVGLVTAALVAAALPMTGLLPEPFPENVGGRAMLMLCLGGLIVLEASRTFFTSYLTSVHRYGLWNVLSLLYELAEVLAVVAGIVAGWSLVAMLAGAAVVRVALLTPLVIGQLSPRHLRWPGRPAAWRAARQAVPLMINEFCLIGVLMADRYAVDLLVGHDSAGVFTMGVTLSRATAVLVAPIFMIVRPEVFSHWDGGARGRALEQLGWAMRYVTVIAVGCFLTIALVGGGLLAIVRPVYAEAAPFLPALAGGYLLRSLIFIPHSVVFAQRRIRAIWVVAVAALVLAAAGHAVLVPWGGAAAAAGVTAGAYGLWLAALCWLARREMGAIARHLGAVRLAGAACVLAAVMVL